MQPTSSTRPNPPHSTTPPNAEQTTTASDQPDLVKKLAEELMPDLIRLDERDFNRLERDAWPDYIKHLIDYHTQSCNLLSMENIHNQEDVELELIYIRTKDVASEAKGERSKHKIQNRIAHQQWLDRIVEQSGLEKSLSSAACLALQEPFGVPLFTGPSPSDWQTSFDSKFRANRRMTREIFATAVIRTHFFQFLVAALTHPDPERKKYYLSIHGEAQKTFEQWAKM